jgi:hypothetical protein
VGISTITSMRYQVPYHRKKVQGAGHSPIQSRAGWVPSRPGTRHTPDSICSIAPVQKTVKVKEKLLMS